MSRRKGCGYCGRRVPPEVRSPTCPRRRCIRCRVGVADPATRFMRHVHGRHRAAMTCRACSFPRTPAPIPASESQLSDEHWAQRRWIIRERIAFLADPIGHPWPASPSRDPRAAVARTAREPLSNPSRSVRDGASAVSVPRLMAVLWHPHRRGAATHIRLPNAGRRFGRWTRRWCDGSGWPEPLITKLDVQS